MKRNTLIATAIVLLVALLFSACQAAQPTSAASAQPTQTTAPAPTATPTASPTLAPTPKATATPTEAPATEMPTATPDKTAAVQAFQFTEAIYKKGAISIQYPQITGYSDKAIQDKLNKLISDAALGDQQEVKDNPDLREYKVTDTVSLNRSDVISVCFNGYFDVKDTAHPSNFFYAITIDVKKQQAVTLPQLIAISPDFLKVMSAGTFTSVNFDITEDIADTIKNDIAGDADTLINFLRSADTAGSDFSSFLTEDSLGLSVSVGHALGDHIEILIDFSDLVGFQTDNPLWKAIEGN